MLTIQVISHRYAELHTEWIGSLLAYEEELRSMRLNIEQLQSTVNDFKFMHALTELSSEVDMLKLEVIELSKSVLSLRKELLRIDADAPLAFATMLENNRLREKIRKAEQAVFMLKFQLGKFLSKAS